MATPQPQQATPAALIRAVRNDAISHEEQHAALAAAARRAIITAVAAGTICHRGADDALAACGLPALPKLWPVDVEIAVAYRRTHRNAEYAVAAAHHTICDRLTAVLPDSIGVGPTRHEKATPAGTDVGEGQQVEFDVTATVVLTLPVTATDRETAIGIARDELNDEIKHAAGRLQLTLDVDHAQWDAGQPRDAVLDPDEDAPAHRARRAPGWDRSADTEQQLAEAHRRQSKAHLQLAALRRAIRTRAIRAVRDDLAHLDDAAERVDGFLTGLGLPPLPQAWLVCIDASTIATVHAADACQARAAVSAAAHARWSRRHERVSNDDLRIDTPHQGEDGRWSITCRESLRIWSRATDEPAAADAATRLARAHLDALDLPQLHGHRLAVTGTAQVVDPVLDPDRD